MDIEDFSDIIKKTEIFNHLAIEDIYGLFASIDYKIVTIDKDIFIHKRDEICNSIIIILEGNLSLSQCNYNNKSFNIYNFTDGDIVGTNCIFAKHNTYKFNIYTKSTSTLLYIPQNEVLNLCTNDKVFLQQFLMHMSNLSQKLLDKIRILTNKNIRSSVMQFLNDQYNNQNSLKIKLNMSKKEIAELLGVERTSLSRELKSMHLDGLIDYDTHSITIISLDDIIINK